MLKRTIHTSCKTLQGKVNSFNLLDVFSSAKDLTSTNAAQRVSVDTRFVPDFNNKTTYDPFDFSIASQRYQNKVNKTRIAKKLGTSSFNTPEIDPTNFYTLPHLLSPYVNQSGQILHRSVTGLANKKQKAIGKAIRRARAFGLMSSVAKDVSSFPKRGNTL